MDRRGVAVACSCALMCLLLGTTLAECEDSITTPLTARVVPDSIRFYEGRFTDVWLSEDTARLVNLSSTVISNGPKRNITSYVLYRTGESHIATGTIQEEANSIIKIKVDHFHTPGLIFPLYSSPEVLGYYNCYLNVTGKGVSVISVRHDSLPKPDVIHKVMEAQHVFETLQNSGIPINDGINTL